MALSRDPRVALARLHCLEAAFPWQPGVSPPPLQAFDGVEAVVHLAGASTWGRWSAAKKRAIYDSRVTGTRHLVSALQSLEERPKVLLSASAVGYYGDRGEEVLTEGSTHGSDFLARLCQEWEQEACQAQAMGVRVVLLRTGLVLGPAGGLLRLLLLPFRLGLGGPIGSGSQWWPWVHLEDVVGLVLIALANVEVRGPLNATAPQPVRQREFARALGRALGRPAFLPVPSFALKLALGEAYVTALTSSRVIPQAAQQLGYAFRYPELEPALRQILSG